MDGSIPGPDSGPKPIPSPVQISAEITNLLIEVGNKLFNQYKISIVNISSQILPDYTTTVTANSIIQFWSAEQASALNGVYKFTLPNWIVADGGLKPGQQHLWGFVSEGGAQLE